MKIITTEDFVPMGIGMGTLLGSNILDARGAFSTVRIINDRAYGIARNDISKIIIWRAKKSSGEPMLPDVQIHGLVKESDISVIYSMPRLSLKKNKKVTSLGDQLLRTRSQNLTKRTVDSFPKDLRPAIKSIYETCKEFKITKQVYIDTNVLNFGTMGNQVIWFDPLVANVFGRSSVQKIL